MPERQFRLVDGALQAVVLAAGAYYLLAYLVVAVLRMPYPFELEWLEGIALEHVRRILAGQPIYVAPSLTFVPLNYTPFFFQLSAAVATVLGPTLLSLRLVSFVSSLVMFALLFLLVRRETRSPVAAAVAVGLFAAAYRLGGAWLDIARADSLCLAFVAVGVWVIRTDPSPIRAPLLAALAFALGFASKQSALVMVAPLMLWLLVRDPRRGGLLAAAYAVLVGATALALDAKSHGWFRYYVFDVARRHPMSADLVWKFPLHDLRAIAPALAVAALALVRRESRPALEAAGFYTALLLGLFASSWQLRLYPGGYHNVLMPTHLGMALVAAMGWAFLLRSDRPGLGKGLATVGSLLLILEFGHLWWNPIRQIPTAADRAANQTLLDLLRSSPGRVFIPSHSYLASIAGKPEHLHVMAFMDVVQGPKGPIANRLSQAMVDTLQTHAYPTLVMDTHDPLLDEALEANYVVRGEVFSDPAVGWPVTGMRTRPEFLLTPAGSDPQLPDARSASR